MGRSTGPILAIGAITITNRTIFNNQPMDWGIPIATGVAVVMFDLLEQAASTWAVGLAWLALAAVTLTRIDPSVPAPAESFLAWWNADHGKR